MIAFTRLATVLIGLLALAGALLVASPTPASAATTTITVGDFWFCSASFDGGVCETTIHAGDTVVWDFSQAMNQHTTTECGASCDSPSASPLWDSGRLNSGTFQFTFTEAGTFLYHCQVHPTEMRGRIVVQAAATPTATPTLVTSGTFPFVTQPPTATPGGTLPTAGQGTQSGSADWWLVVALLGLGAGPLAIGALALHRRNVRT